MDKFDIVKKIGKGSFASVYQVRRKDDNQLYALKRVCIPNMSANDKERALNEIRVLVSFCHPNIISYKESFYSEDTKNLDIIMEYAEEGDILSLIKKAKINKTVISETIIWTYMIHILLGLKTLHEKKFIHRDLKSANVFICKGNIAKIGDFNVAKRLKTSSYLQSQTGTPYYASPEIWLEKPYDMRSDIWSLGCIIYEMCTLQVPFQASSIPLLSKAIVKGDYKPIPVSYSKSLEMILSELLVTDINKRKTSEELLKNSIISKKMESLNIVDIPNVLNLMDTIKLPNEEENLNSVLPKIKKYSSQSQLIFVSKREFWKKDEPPQLINIFGKERALSTKTIGNIQKIHYANGNNCIFQSGKNIIKEGKSKLINIIENKEESEQEQNRKDEKETLRESHYIDETNSCKGIHSNDTIAKRVNKILYERRILNKQKFDNAKAYIFPRYKKLSQN